MVSSNDTPAEPTVSFTGSLLAMGNNTGIVVPADLVAALGAGQRPPVSVVVNGHTFLSTVAVMGGQHLISVSAAIRKETGLKGGDPIEVSLTLASAPRTVEMPHDFAAALQVQPGARAFFDGLANSLQRYHVDNINGTKSPETRARRIDKAVALFLSGKQR